MTTRAQQNWRTAAVILCLLLANAANAEIDAAALWDFQHPEVSEQRFRDALARASGDDVLILQAQIARTYGLRGNFTRARQLLAEIAPEVSTAGAVARICYQLELGRSYASATHPPELLTEEAKQHARAAFNEALVTAQRAQVDMLAIDAIHMLAFVDTTPEDQLKWAQAALKVVLASTQPSAKLWEASIRNNLGYALFQLHRYDEALQEFRLAIPLREARGEPATLRVAYFMEAMTLRVMGQLDAALGILLRLENESGADVDPDIYDELTKIYQAKGDAARANHYRALKDAAKQP